MAGLTRAELFASSALLLVSLILFAPASAIGGDPAGTPRPPTCAERYPAPGPAGVDLRLGCIVSEVVGLWRPEQASAPPTLSAYAITLAVAVAAVIGLGIVGARLVRRHAGERLAPTTPDAWWVCAACHSINGLSATRCYNCAAPRPEDLAAALLPTSDEPSTPQSFGRGTHD